MLSPLRPVLVSGLNTIIFKDADEYDLRGKCNALILLADVIENHEIVSDEAPREHNMTCLPAKI